MASGAAFARVGQGGGELSVQAGHFARGGVYGLDGFGSGLMRDRGRSGRRGAYTAIYGGDCRGALARGTWISKSAMLKRLRRRTRERTTPWEDP